jgi:hypothetical protein
MPSLFKQICAVLCLVFGLWISRAEVLGSIDDPQVFRSAALDGRLRQSAPSARDEVRWLYYHPFTASGKPFPPSCSFFPCLCVGNIYLLVWCCKQQTVAG